MKCCKFELSSSERQMHAMRLFVFALFTSVFMIGQAQATTWDEPWHREVVSAATSFGLYEIEKSGPDSVTLKRVKNLAGEDTGDTIQVASFYALRLTSRSGGHGPEFNLPAGSRAYFYLKRAGSTWAIATPTAGYAALGADGTVRATYRISVHQAVIEAKLYEETQRCIFQVLHGKSSCDPQIAVFIDTQLAKPAEGITADSTPNMLGEFFRQHAALETAGFIGHALPDDTLERFLSKQDMHVQISALRALVGGNRTDKAERLMRFVEDEKSAPTARILAALLLKEIGAREMKQRLLDYAANASEEEAGLGIAIMDPRIGTNFPSTLKQAVKLAGEKL
jgi:hypothetical protein